MSTKIFVGAIAVAVFFGTIYNAVWAYTNSQVVHENVEEKMSTDKDDHQESIDTFLLTLEQIDLGVGLVSNEATVLAKLFAQAASAIQELEAEGEYGRAQVYRTEIQNAISVYMERPGALEADISENIDAYSRYLTETLIAQASL